MEDKSAAGKRGYLLSEDGFRELCAIRAQLSLMADITCCRTAEGDKSECLSIARDLIGWYFEHIGEQIDDVLAATPAVRYFFPAVH